MNRQSRVGVSIAVCVVLLIGTVGTIAIGYAEWLQTGNDANHNAYSPGISTYPIDEFPHPTSGGIPTYAHIASLPMYMGHAGNINTHISAWFEGEQVENNLNVAFTTTNDDDVGAIFVNDADGDEVGNWPNIFQHPVTGVQQANIESSVAVYQDNGKAYQEEPDHETVLVAALNDVSDGYGQNIPNQVRCYPYDLDAQQNMNWYFDCGDWVSRHCSPVVWENPEWGDSDDEEPYDDDFVYVLEFDEVSDPEDPDSPGQTRVCAIDLTEDVGCQKIDETYHSEWFEGYVPSYVTPCIREFPDNGGSGPGIDTYMFLALDEMEYSDVYDTWITTASHIIAIDLNPDNMVGTPPDEVYDTFFDYKLPYYETLEIPDPQDPQEEIDLYLTVNTDLSAVWMEDNPGQNDWYGVVFGIDRGSDEEGNDIYFVDILGSASESYNLQYQYEPYGSDSDIDTNPLVVGSPAILSDPYGANPDEIYVLYHDRGSDRIGTAYFDEINSIGENQIYQAPVTLPELEYLPMSPAITDEFLYVGCHCGYTSANAPYEYDGGMAFINLETIRNNVSVGFFYTFPWALSSPATNYDWAASPAIIQVSSAQQYMYMGTASTTLVGGNLYRLSVQ